MTQNGVVTKLLEHGQAEVAVDRSAACGSHCGGCETCIYADRLLVPAENIIYAKVGDRVVLESSTGGILGAAGLVYLVPLACFFAGYAVGAAAGLAQGGCVAASMGGLVLGAAVAVFIGRRKKRISFRITGYCR